MFGWSFFRCSALFLLTLGMSFLLLGCKSEKEASLSFDDASQRSLIEAFSRAYFRGEEEAAYAMLSSKDQAVIAKPLTNDVAKDAKNQEVIKDWKPWKLLDVVDVTNPYDIKSIEPQEHFSSRPAANTTSDVVVNRYNGSPQRYRLVWGEHGWKIDLGL